MAFHVFDANGSCDPSRESFRAARGNCPRRSCPRQRSLIRQRKTVKRNGAERFNSFLRAPHDICIFQRFSRSLIRRDRERENCNRKHGKKRGCQNSFKKKGARLIAEVHGPVVTNPDGETVTTLVLPRKDTVTVPFKLTSPVRAKKTVSWSLPALGASPESSTEVNRASSSNTSVTSLDASRVA